MSTSSSRYIKLLYCKFFPLLRSESIFPSVLQSLVTLIISTKHIHAPLIWNSRMPCTFARYLSMFHKWIFKTCNRSFQIIHFIFNFHPVQFFSTKNVHVICLHLIHMSSEHNHLAIKDNGSVSIVKNCLLSQNEFPFLFTLRPLSSWLCFRDWRVYRVNTKLSR